MKKIYIILLVATLIFSMAIVGFGCKGAAAETTTVAETTTAAVETTATTVAEDNSPYKVGVTLALSGPMAWCGIEPRDALEMEIKRINENGGVNGRELQLIIEDNAGDPAKAAAAFTKLVKEDKVVAVIGPIFGALVPTITSLAEREKVPNIILCPSDKNSRDFKYVYFIPHNEKQVAPVIVDYLIKNNIKSAITFACDEPLWLSLASGIKEEGDKKGLNIFESSEVHASDTIDTTPQLTKIKAIVDENNIECIIAVTHGGAGAVIAKNMEAIGLDIPMIGTHAFGIPFTISIGGESVNGIKFPTEKIVVPGDLEANTDHNKLVIDFATRFKETYNKDATVWSANGYDGLYLLVDALKRSGNDREALRNELENTKGFMGTNGIFNYSATDHDGLGADGLVWVEIKDGAFKLMK
ncbi:MAG: ABC transporter substrate-binding protein [Candidatus Humimicrobiaceae bacterium]